MKTIITRNVNGALQQGISLIKMYGEEIDSRVGKTLELPEPVATTYYCPWERVLINKERDANPFFHLMESMWILSGREDAKFLCEFNKNMINYSDDGETFNAPYGHRLRNWVSDNGTIDQLFEVIEILKKDPNSRQAVCQIWDERDLTNTFTKDKACNMSIVFRIRKGHLCMIVYNRSNDMIWGAYGANVVQFSIIQEYVAAHLNLPMGQYTQITNSYHVYTEGKGGEVWNRIKDQSYNCENVYSKFNYILQINKGDIHDFEYDLNRFFVLYDTQGISGICDCIDWKSHYFNKLIIPMLSTYLVHKRYGAETALQYVKTIYADDWRMACEQWLQTRIENKENK